ncbi:hypothetical protein P154DRAFT_572522 [Amniculicola lignicola CBS 123094]|uniref:Uncharacterized protein n=1 Tax=Amniculicola lignicola CBS 123094 TaxID=1392246 RepID=A0A6A5X1H4_9PLEO|nr:hypothetical protein P154DRAFT_572522 [Amniculicola lignicola CBS 123094]
MSNAPSTIRVPGEITLREPPILFFDDLPPSQNLKARDRLNATPIRDIKNPDEIKAHLKVIWFRYGGVPYRLRKVVLGTDMPPDEWVEWNGYIDTWVKEISSKAFSAAPWFKPYWVGEIAERDWRANLANMDLLIRFWTSLIKNQSPEKAAEMFLRLRKLKTNTIAYVKRRKDAYDLAIGTRRILMGRSTPSRYQQRQLEFLQRHRDSLQASMTRAEPQNEDVTSDDFVYGQNLSYSQIPHGAKTWFWTHQRWNQDTFASFCAYFSDVVDLRHIWEGRHSTTARVMEVVKRRFESCTTYDVAAMTNMRGLVDTVRKQDGESSWEDIPVFARSENDQLRKDSGASG